MRRSWLFRVALVAVPVAVIAGISSTALAAPTTHKSSSVNTEVTLYGWNDNSPPGCATAYSGCAHSGGTFSKPTTFATDRAELAVGTIIYYAPLKRYFVMGDDCVACDNDWNNSGKRHIDLWAGGANGDNANALFACEDKWTVSSGTIIVNPPGNEPVANNGKGGPIFRVKSSTCWSG